MKIENKKDIVNFIESHLAELGGEAYGVNYIAEKLFEWHESELKNLSLGVVVGRSEQLCRTFLSDGTTTSATKCRFCGKEKWEH